MCRSSLISGTTKSCGCIKSIGERETSSVLRKFNIKYKQQYSFDDLRTSKNGIPRFDFGILNQDNTLNFLIEYQGIQHYIPDIQFGKIEREETDELKKEYCRKNNIKLYEILYNENIEEAVTNILSGENLIVS